MKSHGMRVAIIGAGDIGSALATLFSRRHHTVILGVRDPTVAAPLAKEIGAPDPVTYREAVESCDIICFCIPWEYSESVLEQLGDLSGKILIDPTNPETADGRALEFGHSISGAEILADRAPGAKVVKAFNYIYAELLRDELALSRLAPSIFVCGDHDDAKETVARLVGQCGLEAIDCGPLRNARYLEPMALLMVHLVREEGWPAAGAAFKLSHTR